MGVAAAKSVASCGSGVDDVDLLGGLGSALVGPAGDGAAAGDVGERLPAVGARVGTGHRVLKEKIALVAKLPGPSLLVTRYW